jgi:acyl transferase domain-containing protein
MLAVPLPVEDLREFLPADLDLAAVNGPASCVVAGKNEAVAAFEGVLERRGLRSLRLRTSHAFHSRLMEGALARFREALADTTLSPPGRLWISNVTGRTVTAEQAADPDYWVEHMRTTVRFGDGVAAALGDGVNVFLELGGRPTLRGVILQTAAEYGHPDPVVVSATRHPQSSAQASDVEYLTALGTLWKRGVAVDWDRFHGGDGALRVPLPAYPFEGVRVALPQQEQDGDSRPRPAAAPAGPAPRAPAALPSYHASAPDAARAPRPPDYQTAYVEPGDEVEAEVAEIFSRVLGVAPVGAHDNIFDLGGNSIMLVHVVNQLSAAFGLQVPIREVVANPVPSRLADAVRRLRLTASPGEQPVSHGA